MCVVPTLCVYISKQEKQNGSSVEKAIMVYKSRLDSPQVTITDQKISDCQLAFSVNCLLQQQMDRQNIYLHENALC